MNFEIMNCIFKFKGRIRRHKGFDLYESTEIEVIFIVLLVICIFGGCLFLGMLMKLYPYYFSIDFFFDKLEAYFEVKEE